ncbi:MAG: hypothetical protein SD837_10740 [Candidatus Electrothrix scaldis]|nr:MAG: hypothetical protein SD837_10740 [Candidatus Electrothrix sp. GW3-3]
MVETWKRIILYQESLNLGDTEGNEEDEEEKLLPIGERALYPPGFRV